MDFYILTLFPEMVMNGLSASITGRAMEKGAISVGAIDIRDYSHDKHHHVDDGPYGGGAGLVMQPGPVVEAYEALSERLGKRPRLIYMTPQGRVFDQKLAEELSMETELVFLCGHYEGIDERALELVCTDQVSIGDYVLTGGELPAMVMIDCIARLVPGVLHNEGSAEEESIPSIPARRSSVAWRCRPSSSPATTRRSMSGGGSSRSSAPWSGGRICWRRRS